jgi:hypothetical protein
MSGSQERLLSRLRARARAGTGNLYMFGNKPLPEPFSRFWDIFEDALPYMPCGVMSGSGTR